MSETWTIGELADRAAEALGPSAPRANGRVRDVPNERLIRWYTTIGLLDPPLTRRGRVALYGRRHLLQLVAVKRRQAEGLSIAAIQIELTGAPDAVLESLARLPSPTSHGLSTPKSRSASHPSAPPPKLHKGTTPDLGTHPPDPTAPPATTGPASPPAIPTPDPRTGPHVPATPWPSAPPDVFLPSRHDGIHVTHHMGDDPPPVTAAPAGSPPAAAAPPPSPPSPVPATTAHPATHSTAPHTLPPGHGISEEPISPLEPLIPPTAPPGEPHDREDPRHTDNPPYTPDVARPRFWAERPATFGAVIPESPPGGHRAPPDLVPPGSGALIHGVRLARGVTLLLDGRMPGLDDVAAIRSAAGPLLALLQELHLLTATHPTEPNPSDTTAAETAATPTTGSIATDTAVHPGGKQR